LKFGLIYSKEGQKTELEMLANTKGKNKNKHEYNTIQTNMNTKQT